VQETDEDDVACLLLADGEYEVVDGSQLQLQETRWYYYADLKSALTHDEKIDFRLSVVL
jgi:hypothetical protein